MNQILKNRITFFLKTKTNPREKVGNLLSFVFKKVLERKEERGMMKDGSVLDRQLRLPLFEEVFLKQLDCRYTNAEKIPVQIIKVRSPEKLEVSVCPKLKKSGFGA